jgi:hypothetical protein
MSMKDRLKAASATDEGLERDGIKYVVSDDEGPVMWMMLARAGGANKNFIAALDRIIKPIRRAWDNEMVPTDKKVAIVREAIAESCVKAWGSTEHGDGKVELESGPVTLSKANALQFFIEYPNIYDDVLDITQKSGNYRREGVKSDAGK